MLKVIIPALLLLPLQAKINKPQNYESLTACEKQEILWENIEKTQYKKLPSFKSVGAFEILKMAVQGVKKKVRNETDFAPRKWKKYLHRRGVMAKVKLKPLESEYSGIFKGSDCSLIRLSLTYAPNKKKDDAVAPGLAFKVLRDGVPSANVSALYTLQGQEFNYNFFANPLSNIIPVGDDWKLAVVSRIFESVTDYPEQLGVLDMASIDVKGEKEKNVKSPRQIFFVPNPDIALQDSAHDIRQSISKIKAGTLLYTVHAVSNEFDEYNYVKNYKRKDIKDFVKKSTPIAEIVTTSDFIASKFGDIGIFFRHEKAD